MSRSEQVEEFDVVVIGGGPAGENAADYAIRGSDRTAAIVEAELLGGECSYWACMPSKALLRPLDVAASAAHLGGLSEPVLDRDALLARRDSWVSNWKDAGQVKWADGAGITVVRGRGRLAGERTVEVAAPDGSTRTLRARSAVVLATGSVAVIPEPYAGLAPWTSRDATAVTEVPESIAVIGGGVVAVEAARWLAALGSDVTLIVRDDRLLGRAEDVVFDFVVKGLQYNGVDVRLSTEITDATRADADPDAKVGTVHGGPVTLTLADGIRLEVAEVLVATGRRPATDDLGLESVGLSAEDLRGVTSGDPLPAWLHTVGDVNGAAPLTHWGKYQARLVGRRIAGDDDAAELADVPNDVPVPQVVFTDPQVAWVGMTSAEAREKGLTVTVVDTDYTSASGAGLLRDDATGTCRLVVDTDRGVLVGATFVGPEVAELLHSATVAITGEVPVARLHHAVPSYPTASEVWLRLLDQLT